MRAIGRRLGERFDGPDFAGEKVVDARHRVLLVEDEPDIREMLRECLRAKCTVRVAEDGIRALQLLSRQDFDALVVDLELPGLSGFTLVRMLRARGIRTPVLLVSAAPEAQTLARSIRVEFLSKPFDLDLFEAKVARLLDCSKEQPTESR
jgi:DNA-binding response OmpR family regulator